MRKTDRATPEIFLARSLARRPRNDDQAAEHYQPGGPEWQAVTLRRVGSVSDRRTADRRGQFLRSLTLPARHFVSASWKIRFGMVLQRLVPGFTITAPGQGAAGQVSSQSGSRGGSRRW